MRAGCDKVAYLVAHLNQLMALVPDVAFGTAVFERWYAGIIYNQYVHAVNADALGGRASVGLFSVSDGAFFADHRYFDLTRIGHFGLYFLSYFKA